MASSDFAHGPTHSAGNPAIRKISAARADTFRALADTYSPERGTPRLAWTWVCPASEISKHLLISI